MKESSKNPGPKIVRANGLAAVERVLKDIGYRAEQNITGRQCDFVVSSAITRAIFRIKVRVFRKPNNWIIPAISVQLDLYYVLAVVSDRATSRFFIMSQREVEYERERSRKRLGRPPDYKVQGFNFSETAAYEGHWESLPK